MADESKIRNDQYGLLKDFQEFTEKYFEVSPDNTKVGLFGYMNEIVAHATKVSAYHRNALYNEIALNTASIPETIYSAAADEGVDATEAVPSKATVLVTFVAKDLLDLIKSNPKGIVKLDRESFVVNMDSTYFHLPYSIFIHASNEGVLAMYNSTDIIYDGTVYPAEPMLLANTEFYKSDYHVEAVNLPDAESTDDKAFIQLKVDVYQYEVENETHDLTSSSLANSINFQIDVENQLAGFLVTYKEEDMEEYLPIDKYQNRSLVISDVPYCLYSFIDENSFQIMFDLTSDGWRPANGSSCVVKSCTTLGSGGNFNFSGDLHMEDPNVNLEITGFMYSQPSGGKDRPTIKELKQAVYNKRQKVEALSTEEDLNTYFEDLSSSSFSNSISRVFFERSIDTIVSRLFKGFVLLGDSNGRPFPMNTAELLYLSADAQGRKYINSSNPIIPHVTSTVTESGTILVEDTKKFDVLADNADVGWYIDRGIHVYFSPFVIQQFNGDSWKFFDFSVNEFLYPYFKEVLSDAETIPVINYLKIRRRLVTNEFEINEPEALNGNEEGFNHLTIELATTYTDEDPKKVFMVVITSPETSTKMGILYSSPSDALTTKSCFAKVLSENKAYCEAGSTPSISVTRSCYEMPPVEGMEDYPYWVIDLGRAFDLAREEETDPSYDKEIRLGQKAKATIYIMERYDDDSSTPFGNLAEYEDFVSCINAIAGGTANFRDSRILDYFDNTKYRVRAVSEVAEAVNIFKDVSSIFRTSKTSSTSGGTVLHEIPLIGAEVKYNDAYYQEFIQEYKSYLDVLDKAIPKLVNNTELTMKFYNSYGPSDKWLVRTTTIEQEEEQLEKVGSSDLEIYIDLERENGQDDEVEAVVKQIVEDFFKDLNIVGNAGVVVNNKISLTKLTTAIEKAVPSVSAANIIRINKVENPRFIVLNKDRSENYPEYTNIGLPVKPGYSDKTDFPDSPRIIFHYTF